MVPENQINVILVDEKDNQIGTMEKLAAHQNGARLHRAFSLCLFNSKGETLMQRRAMHKYHSKGKWSNTCCSHPGIGESVIEATRRRAKEEMGIECGELRDVFSFVYKVEVGDGLTEHEYDHVVFGRYDGPVNPNPNEVMDYRWISLADLGRDVKEHPENYTGWLAIAIDRIISEARRFS